MFTFIPTSFLKNFIQNIHINSDTKFNIDKAEFDGKQAIRGLLEKLNAKYLSELRMDPHKEADFMYSNYSPTQQLIKRDEKHKLKDIV